MVDDVVVPDATPAVVPAVVPAAPAIDMDALAASMRSSVQDALAGFVQANQPPPQQGPTSTGDPLADVVLPLVKPSLDRANVMAEAARDQSLFFQRHPEALEHQDALLTNWNLMLQKNIPFKMETIWNEYRGANFDKFHGKASERDTAKLQAAKDAEVVGPGSPDRSGGRGTIRDASEVPPDELAKALEGVAF